MISLRLRCAENDFSTDVSRSSEQHGKSSTLFIPVNDKCVVISVIVTRIVYFPPQLTPGSARIVPRARNLSQLEIAAAHPALGLCGFVSPNKVSVTLI